jgi:hypothetical protein
LGHERKCILRLHYYIKKKMYLVCHGNLSYIVESPVLHSLSLWMHHLAGGEEEENEDDGGAAHAGGMGGMNAGGMNAGMD